MKIVGDASGRKKQENKLYIEDKIKELESNQCTFLMKIRKNYLWHL